MAMKNYIVETKMGEGFKMTSQIGNHTLYIDQPKNAGGSDAGPNPIQYFLLSLSGCIGAVARIIATQRKIELRSITIKIQGDIDTDRLLGISTEQRAGLDEIKIHTEIDADMSDEEKEAFLAEVDSRCPISDNISNGTKITLLLN